MYKPRAPIKSLVTCRGSAVIPCMANAPRWIKNFALPSLFPSPSRPSINPRLPSPSRISIVVISVNAPLVILIDISAMVNGNGTGNGIGLDRSAPADPMNASQMAAAIQRPGPTPTSLVSTNNTKRPKPITTDATTTAPGKSPNTKVVCQTCKHQFSRPYHLARHFRTTGHSNTIELNDVVKSETNQFDVFIAAPEKATENLKDWNKPVNGTPAYEQRQDQRQQQSHWQNQQQQSYQQQHQQSHKMKSESRTTTNNEPKNQSLTLPLPLHPHPVKAEEMKSPRSPQPTEPDYIGDEAREGVWGYLLFPGSFTGITLKNRHMSEGSVRISSDSGNIIGRSPRCDVIIDGPTIADIQCFLFVQFDANNFAIASVEALADSGTVVQGTAVGRGQRRQLEDGDEVVLDEAKFVFRYPDRYRRRAPAEGVGNGNGNGRESGSGKSPGGWS